MPTRNVTSLDWDVVGCALPRRPALSLRRELRFSFDTREGQFCGHSQDGCALLKRRDLAGCFIFLELRAGSQAHTSLLLPGPDAAAGPGEAALVPLLLACAMRSCACTALLVTTVEMACLKMSCSWLLLVSSTTEYLSNERIRPVSLTPLSR